MNLSASLARRQGPPLSAFQVEQERRRTETDRQRWRSEADAIRKRCVPLYGFIKEAWPIVHPVDIQTGRAADVYVPNWHIEMIAEHLEAITWGWMIDEGRQNRLLTNVPPGGMKSLLFNVMWTAWEWGPCGMPWLTNAAASFRVDSCKRDARRVRDLIASEWFQSLWGREAKLPKDHPQVWLERDGELSLSNNHKGTYDGIPFGSLMGGRFHRLKIDDPHSIDTAESDADRTRTEMRFRESASQRLVDPKTSSITLTMQRLHQNDLSGVVLREFPTDYTHVMLPMEFEPERRCITPFGRDPRREPDELLCPARWDRATVERDKRALGPHATAGQLQQRPTARAGGLIKRAYFEGKIVPAAPECYRWVRHWDLAATGPSAKKKKAAFTAGVKLGRTPEGRFVVASVIRAKMEGVEVRATIKAQAPIDGVAVEVSLPQDPGQAGKVQAQDMVAMLAGYVVHAEPETGDKLTRLEPFAVQLAAGNVVLVEGEWNAAYIDELCSAGPGAAYMDQADATSGAFTRLAGSTYDSSMRWVRG